MQIALVAASRIGVYDRLPGVDIEKFSAAVSGSGFLGYIDNITGGSISNVGVFSLGIIPAINASIFLQVRLCCSTSTLSSLTTAEVHVWKRTRRLYSSLWYLTMNTSSLCTNVAFVFARA